MADMCKSAPCYSLIMPGYILSETNHSTDYNNQSLLNQLCFEQLQSHSLLTNTKKDSRKAHWSS